MRITGGRYVRRTISVPKRDIRPAMDRMRESIFAVLGEIEGLSFLDLFAGSGSIGLEAASRGAAPVVMVERDRRKRSYLERNVELIDGGAQIVIAPVERYIRSAQGPFDLIFLDPPFPYQHKQDLVERVAQSLLVRPGEPGTLVLIHYPAEDSLPDSTGSLIAVDDRKYGRSQVRIYRSGSTIREDSV